MLIFILIIILAILIDLVLVFEPRRDDDYEYDTLGDAENEAEIHPGQELKHS